MGVGTAHAFVDHVIQRHVALEFHIHTDVHEHGHNAGVLADRAMALGAHAGVNQNLGHGILGRLGLFLLVGLVHGLNEILRVVIGNELQRIGYAFDQVVLADHGGHSGLISFLIIGSMRSHQSSPLLI